MKNDNSKNIIIILLTFIIIILTILVILFATNTISLNINTNSNNNNNNETLDNNNEENNQTPDQATNREEIINKLKQALTNQEWIKENLYAKENCFGDKVDTIEQKLKFIMLSNSQNNPIVIILNETSESFILTSYKVYYENGEVLAKNITDSISHPSHINITVDQEQGFVIYTYMHMGYYSLTAYDVKNNEIKIYDKYEYECTTGECDYEYKGEKEYNAIYPEHELNITNINNYIK